ncbi:MAG: TonB-dependent receptor [Gammaproteobacteria bacterium]|nr:TonB-dependent receptor [Gammaproteobacteria bacterium]
MSGYNIYRCNEGGSRCTPTWIHWVNGRTTSYRDDGTAVVDPDGEGGEPGAPIGFTSGANYRYAVLAQRAGVDSPWSNQVTTRQEAPRPSGGGGGGSGGSSEETRPVRPVGLTVTAVTTESISLRWQPSPNGEDGSVYDIYRCTVPDGASTCDPYNDLWLARLQDTNTYNDTEIVAGETYRYQVAAGRSSGRENLSGAITVATQTSPVATPAPTDLAVIDTGERSVSLSWTLPADDGRGPIQSIHIYRCDVERSPDCSEFLHAASRNPALTEYRDNDVEPATTYRYAVASYRSAQEASPWSNQVAASTQSPVPAAPTGLTVTATSETEIALSWTAPEGVVEAYNIFRCVQREQGCTPEWYKWLDGGRTTTFTDTDLTAGAEYRYAVEAIRYNRSTSPWSEWKSPWSDQVTATASAAPVIVQAPAPTELAVVSATDTAISLSWTAPADDGHGEIFGYNVYRCEEGESPCEPQWMAWVDGGNTTNYTDDGTADPDNDGTPIGLTTGATYRYAVGASRGQGTESPWSNQVTAQAGTVADPVSPEEQSQALESGLITLGRTMAQQAVDTFGGRFASLSSPTGAAETASGRPESFAEALKITAERIGLPAVADIDNVDQEKIEWGPWMSGGDLLTEATCAATVAGCAEDVQQLSIADNLSLRRLLSNNSFQLALGAADEDEAPAWTLWGWGNMGGFKGESRHGLALDGELAAGFLGLDYRWGTDALLGVAVSHSQGDMDYGDSDAGVGELEATLRSIYPYAYWSPRPGLGLWGILGYGFGETALQDAAVNTLETDVVVMMAAMGGRNELFRLGGVDLAAKVDAFGVRTKTGATATVDATRADSSRVRLALEARTNLALSAHSRLTPSLELGMRWDAGDAETGVGTELGGALAYTNSRLGFSVDARGRYLLTHEEKTFEEWGASLSACLGSGSAGTGLGLSLRPVWGNAASGVDALWKTDGLTGAARVSPAPAAGASWQPDRLDLGVRYGSDTARGLVSPFGEVSVQGADAYSTSVGARLDTGNGWKLDVFGKHIAWPAETGDNIVGLSASYERGRNAAPQASLAGALLAGSNWSDCAPAPARRVASRTGSGNRDNETAVVAPPEKDDTATVRADTVRHTKAVAVDATEAVADTSVPTVWEPGTDGLVVLSQTAAREQWLVPVAATSNNATVIARQAAENTAPVARNGAEARTDEDSPGQQNATNGTVTGALEEITVKGIRGSLKDALEVKRAAEHVVEALSLEDIDALPNVTIAEALVRLPGVNGTRDRGNQSQATIRGLGPRMVLGTVNGREVASAEPSRNIRWEQYPSELISQAQVYKTQSADLIAGGIAGAINLETVAPLDYDGPKYTVSGVGAYYEGGDGIPDYNQLGNRFSGSLVKAFNKKFGVALGISSQKQKNAFPSYQGWGFNAPGSWQPELPPEGGDLDGLGNAGHVPWGTQVEIGKMNTDRIGLLGTLQARPTDNIDLRYDMLYSEFDMNIEQNQTWYQGLGNANNRQAGYYSDVAIVDELALAATARSPIPDCIHRPGTATEPQCFDIRHVLSLYQQQNSIFSQGLNLEFSRDSIRADVDIAYSKAERDNYWHGLYFDAHNATFSYDLRGTPSVSVPADSPSARPDTAALVVVDCRTMFCGSVNDNENQGGVLEDENWSYKVDISKAFYSGYLSSVDVGVRYSERDKEVVWEQFKMPRGGDNPAQVLPDLFSSYTLSTIASSPILTAPSFRAAADLFGGVDLSLAEIDEERYWRVSEENLAGYVKANFEGNIGAAAYYTANIGLRVIDVNTSSFDLGGAAISNGYTELLPSASINFFIDEENIIRLSAARAISRPPLDELRVGKLINAPAGNIEGNTGNPLLNPFVAKQIDLSYEWYFAPESLAAATVYYKHIEDYIGYTYLDFEVRDGRVFSIYGPKNEQSGNLRGIELTFQAPFTSLLPKALKGVSAGIYSNYAFADSNIKELYPVENPYTLAGLASHTASMDLWFWWRKFDLRFGWKYHSAFTTGFGWDGSELSTLDAELSVSAGLSYIVNDNITVRLQGYNLTDEPARITRNNDARDLRRFDRYGRAWFLGVNWKMW